MPDAGASGTLRPSTLFGCVAACVFVPRPCRHGRASAPPSPPRALQEAGEPLVTHYELAQSVYAKARVNVHEEDKVCLWLGANVMLEYPREEAILLLKSNLTNAKESYTTCVDDMGHLRDQITTTEVNMARVFNWDVKERRKKKEKEAA